MLTLNDGRSELWQWDTDRKISVDADCSQVHFSNKVFGRSIDVDVVDGVAIIPDILLQTDKELNVWAFVGTAENGYTKISKTFKVNRRNKPADYVFTPPEQTTLGELIERLDKIEESQDPDAIKNAVDDYLANNPIEIDETDPTWAKQTTKPKYTAKEVGAVATVNGITPDEKGNVQIEVGSGGDVDLTGYATEHYVQGYAQPKGDYALRSEIPSVPVKSVNGKTGAVTIDVPTKISQLTNDAGYLTGHRDTSLTMFISPDGSDSNDGLTASTPKKTVNACVNAGATRISAKRGIYNEAIDLRNINDLEIFPTDNEKTYVVGESRNPIVFDTSDKLAVSAVATYNSIKRIAYSNTANAAYNAVFIEKTLDPTASAYQSSYYAAVWLFSDDEKTVCRKPKPVLTVAECEATSNTFCYSGGYIYINADMTGVTKIVVPTITATGFYVNGANNLVLREVEVRFAGEYSFDLRSCAWVDLYKCASKYTTCASGFHPVDTNGVFRACYATKCFDGFAPNGHGHTTYTDCVSEYNYDDGMSHHSGTEGTVIGGRYEGNGKGGNTPAYGAKVNIYGGLYKDNAQWGVGYVGSASAGYVSGMVQGAVMVDNPVGLAVQANCDVIAMNCTYQGNISDKDVSGNLTEYNANYVKTVNGVAPDADGNVNVEVSGGDTGPTYTNVLKSAIDTDGSVFNGTGYKNGYRLNSTATEKQQDTSGYTGFIKITPNQSNTIRMKNLELCSTGHNYVHGYDASFVRQGQALQNDSINTKDENGVVTFDVHANWEYIRISTGLMNAETIITINEPIE